MPSIDAALTVFESLTRRFFPTLAENSKPHRARLGKLQGWVSVVVNVLLFGLKLFLGLVSGSLSLIADAIHTLSDVVSSAVVIWGFAEAEKPADLEHPYGHGRAEYVATLIISILLIVVGIEFIREALSRIRDPQTIAVGWWMIAALAVTVIIKEITARYAEFLSARIESETLRADAWHHRTDALSSILVVIAMIAARYGMHALDGYAGLGVAAIIIWSGIEISRDAIDDLIGKPPSPKDLEAIRIAAEQVPGVLGAHDLIIHSYGTEKIASMHVEIDADQSQLRAHDIAEAVELAVAREFGITPTVHIDPVYTSHPTVIAVKTYFEAAWSDNRDITDFHDLRVVDTENHKVILFGVNFRPDLTKHELKDCYTRLKRDLQERFGEYELVIKISPRHRFS